MKFEFESLFSQLTDLTPSSMLWFEKLKSYFINAFCRYQDSRPTEEGLLTTERLNRSKEPQVTKKMTLKSGYDAGIDIFD